MASAGAVGEYGIKNLYDVSADARLLATEAVATAGVVEKAGRVGTDSRCVHAGMSTSI